MGKAARLNEAIRIIRNWKRSKVALDLVRLESFSLPELVLGDGSANRRLPMANGEKNVRDDKRRKFLALMDFIRILPQLELDKRNSPSHARDRVRRHSTV